MVFPFMAGKYYAFQACARSLLNATAFLFLNSVLITFLFATGARSIMGYRHPLR